MKSKIRRPSKAQIAKARRTSIGAVLEAGHKVTFKAAAQQEHVDGCGCPQCRWAGFDGSIKGWK